MVKSGGAWAGTFVTLDATGAKATPSVGPAGVLYVDGTADAAAVTISGANPYKWAVTLPALTAGQRVDMYITATIATIATAGFVASDQADTVLVSEVKAETALILADTGTDGVVVAYLANDSITAAALKADAITEIQTGLATPTNITAGTITTVTTVTNAPTGMALEATLTAIKGLGWTDETLVTIQTAADAATAPSANDVADAVWNEAIAGHVSVGSTGKAVTDILEDTGTTLPATLASILEDTGTTLPASIALISGGAGPGGTEKVYTVTDSVSGLPIADVHVWVSTDTAGANVIASGYTDVSGQVTFMLDAGTYYLWRQKAGYNFTNPDTEVVT